MRSHRPLCLALLVLCATAAPASAADRIVKPSGTNNAACSAANPCQTVTAGVTSAAEGDRVLISPGTYTEAVTVNKRVALIGAGAGTPEAPPSPVIHTIIQAPVPGTALRMTQGGTVSGLRLLGRANATSAGSGLDLRAAAAASAGPGTPFAYDVTGVVAEGSVNAAVDPADDQAAPGARFSGDGSGAGSVLPVSVRATDSHFIGHGATIAMGGANGDEALRVDGSTVAPQVDVTLTRSTARGAQFGTGYAIVVDNGTADPSRTRLTLDRVTVPADNHATGLSLQGGSTTTVSRSSIVGLTHGVSLVSADPVDLTVRDSVLERRDGTQTSSVTHAGLSLRNGLSTDYRVHLFGTTVAAEESNSNQTETAGMVVDLDDADDKAAIDVHNSVVRGFDDVTTSLRYALAGGAQASTVADHSSITSVVGGGAFTATDAVAGDPRLTDEAGSDFRPLADSPLIDAGSAAHVQSGELDLPGQPRSLDGNSDCVDRPDAGAFELAGRAGAPPSVGARASQARVEAGTRVDFTAEATDADGLGSTAWDIPGAPAVGGLSTSAVLRTPGVNTIAFRATDARGCAAAATTTVQVDRAVAPSVGNVKLAKRFTASKGATLSYRLSESAKVTLRFERRTGKGRKRRWKKVADVVRPAAKPGTVKLKLKRRVAGKALATGSWRIKVVATDLVGLRSRTSTKGFTVVKAKPRKRAKRR